MLKKVYRTKSNNIMPYHEHAHSLPWNVQQIIHFKASNRLIVVNVFFLNMKTQCYSLSQWLIETSNGLQNFSLPV